MAAKRDYYLVLGVSRDATEREIKRSYHRLAREMHPDKASSPDEVKRLEGEFAVVSKAYNTLKDKVKRGEYDEVLQKEQARGVSANSAATAPSRNYDTPSPDTSSVSASSVRRVNEKVDEARVGIAKKAFTKGIQFYKINDFTKAAEFFEAAIKNNDKEALYYAQLSKTLMKQKKSFSRARDMAMKAIELDPYNTEHRFTLAEICEMAGITSLAVQTYREILRWDNANPKAITKLAEIERNNPKSVFHKIWNNIRAKIISR